MKEFSALTGGRYTYADDLENLQELSLAFGQIFDDCDNFIVSGCEVSGTSISSGYLYINGKLRRFTGATGISQWPQYIYEYNYPESVTYESGGRKVGRNIYSCAISQSAPTGLDQLTNQTPAYVTMSSTGGRQMKDAFFGKYALILNPTATTQTVKSNVSLSGNLEAKGIEGSNYVGIRSGYDNTKMLYDGSTFCLTTRTSLGTIYQMKVSHENGFEFYANDILIATIGDNEGIVFNQKLTAQEATIGAITISGSNIYYGTEATNATVNVNMVTGSSYRNFYVGNGKGTLILACKGNIPQIEASAPFVVRAGKGVTLIGNYAKTNNSLTNYIHWTDNSGASMATLGFTSTSNQNFYISSSSFNITIQGAARVDIGPSISENGALLSEKYVLTSNYNKEIATKANASEVYSKVEANDIFGTKSGGLSQFVTETNTAAVCRSHIGAMGQTDLDRYAKLTNYLSDMAVNDMAKQTIRTNIGAASNKEMQERLADTGWQLIEGTEGLYARQIGSVVSIQGTLTTRSSGTVFVLPANIGTPGHTVSRTIVLADSKLWTCVIQSGSRYCTTASTGAISIEFSLTYMV